MNALTVGRLESVTGGTLCGGDPQTPVTGGTFDSRAVRPGDVFAALPGEKTDGHAYIGAALDAGAACCLALRVPEGETRGVLVVPDVAAAFCAAAAYYRSLFRLPLIGVTGSVGKTTAKEMIACVLARRFSTLKTEKNFNNELGVPMTLFRLRPAHEAAVVEMGISHFGEMTRLAQMARPTMAVCTVIGRAHLEFLGDRAGVLRAKTEMLAEMPADGTFFVNGDDDLLAALTCRQEKVTFGLADSCAVRAEHITESGEDGTACEIVAGTRRIPVRLRYFGKHLVYAALAAAAVGLKLGLTDEEIAAGIADYVPVGRRADVVRTPALTLIDDCYNANPDSTAMAIESAAALPGRLVCILGDMLELGGDAARLHRETGELARRRGALLLTVGELSRNMGGMHFDSRRALIDALPGLLHRGDTVLVKASRGMAFEEISEAVKRLTL